MIPVGVLQGDLSRRIVGLVRDWMYDRRADQQCSLHHLIGIDGDDMERVGSGSSRGASLICAGEEDSASVGPIQLAVMDQVAVLTSNDQIFAKSESDQPLAKRGRVVADDAWPDARLANPTVSNAHDNQESYRSIW